MTARSTALAIVLALSAAPLAAQTVPPPVQDPPQPTPETPVPDPAVPVPEETPEPPATLPAPDVPPPDVTRQPAPPEPAPVPSDDQTFIDEATALVALNAAAAAVARTQAGHEETRALAAKLETAHRTLGDTFGALRHGTAAAPPASPATDSNADLTRLRALSSDDFDLAWLDWQAQQHATLIATLERTRGAAFTEEITRAAADALPGLQQEAREVATLRQRITTDAAD